MKINEPRFCRSCKEICYSRLCIGCERPAGELDLDPERERLIQVDEGDTDESYDDGVVALNFDDLYGAESDSD